MLLRMGIFIQAADVLHLTTIGRNPQPSTITYCIASREEKHYKQQSHLSQLEKAFQMPLFLLHQTTKSMKLRAKAFEIATRCSVRPYLQILRDLHKVPLLAQHLSMCRLRSPCNRSAGHLQACEVHNVQSHSNQMNSSGHTVLLLLTLPKVRHVSLPPVYSRKVRNLLYVLKLQQTLLSCLLQQRDADVLGSM